MNLDLTEDQRQVRDAVRGLCEREFAPFAPRWDREGIVPRDAVSKLAEQGFLGMAIPEEWGGVGYDSRTIVVVLEEIARVSAALAIMIAVHNSVGALPVFRFGTDAQRRRFLPRLAAGEARGGLALTEPHAGSDVQAIRTTARRAGDHYVVNGSKMFITNGREGTTFALLAVTDPRAQPRHRGMSCFIVEKTHPGFRVVKSLAKLGYKGVDTVELLFEDCRVPAANLVGGVEGRGFGQVMSGLLA